MLAARTSRGLGALLVATALAGCHDPAAHHDFIDPTIGDATAANKAMQIADPWPRGSFRRDAATDGGRAARVIEDFRKGVESPAATAPSTR